MYIKSILLALVGMLCILHLSAQHPFDVKKTQGSPQQPSVPYQTIHGQQSSHTQPIAPLRLAHRSQHVGVHAGHQIAEDDHGQLVFQRLRQTVNRQSLQDAAAVSNMAHMFLSRMQQKLSIDNPHKEFSLDRFETDQLGQTHVRMQQQYQGVPIHGADMIVHFRNDQTLINGRSRPTPTGLQTKPQLEAEEAIRHAVKKIQTKVSFAELSKEEQEMLNYSGPKSELMIWYRDNQPHLVWRLEIRPNFLRHWFVIVDALNGQMLDSHDHTCSLMPTTANGTDLNGDTRTINTFQLSNGQYILLDASKDMYTGQAGADPNSGDGFIITADFNNTSPSDPTFNEIISNNNTWDATSVSAHYNAGQCYDYFRSTHNRNSINGTGGDIISFINVAEDNGGGMDNAFWNGSAMFYGNGDQAFTPLAGALDVAGHEMAHGVIQATANLEYQGQSGALNESFADFFGAMIDRNDWQLGEDIIPNTNIFPTGFLRDMANPNNGWPAGSNPLSSNGYQPAHMNNLFTGSQDNGGVHINSGIVNKAAHLFAQSVGREKAEAVYYRALSVYLTRSSQFIDARIAVIQSADDLYGQNSTESQAAASAFAQVGIAGGTGTNVDPTLPTNNGQEFILSTDVNVFDPNTLYVSTTTGMNFQPVSQVTPISKTSITDDGTTAFFVANNNEVTAIATDFNNPQTVTVTSDGIWRNVAISKDGSKFAAVTTSQDTSIYVYDYNSQQWARFVLFNPTTANGGGNTGGVLFADAIEWDYTGEYLLYDANNRIPNSAGGDPIEYWDVGLLKVWNNAQNTFGDGSISKVFTNLPAGVSIGNAVFSKNSPNIIAFDLVDANSNEAFLYAANIETGDIGVVLQNDILSYPSYSNDDGFLLLNTEDFFGNERVSIIQLAADKINAASGASASDLIPDARWGVWYADGNRPLSNEALASNTLSLKAMPNPFNEQLRISFSVEKASSVSIEVRNLLGQKVWARQQAQAIGVQEMNLPLSHLPAGQYWVRVLAEGQSSTLSVVKR
ncbi:MAG: M4 family metallopeptidase [Bacteroidota bacterium]